MIKEVVKMFGALVSIILICVGATLLRDGLKGMFKFIDSVFKKPE